MRVVRLTVNNHNRITLGERYIDYVPNKKLGLVLGDNGSGKSTFLGLLFPRVVKLDELDTNGYVHLIIIEEDKEIEIATYKNSNTYHFVLDGEELNPKSSVRLQDELIKRHIKINKDIHDILTGSELFHKSSVKKRREILEYLSGNDYTYINDLYVYINKKFNAEKAILKHTDGRLSDATIALKELETNNESHHSDIKDSRKRLESLIELSNSSARGIDITALEERLEDANKSIENYKSSLKSLLRNASRFPTGSYEKMDDWLAQLEKKNSHIHAAINILSARHFEISEASSENEDHFEKRDALSTTIERDENLINQIPKPALDLLKDITPTNIVSLKSILDTYKFKLRDISEIPSKYFKLVEVDQTVLKNLKESYLELTNKANSMQREITLLDSISREPDIECPKCEFKFKQGYDATTHTSLKSKLSDMEEEIKLLDEQIHELSEISRRYELANQAKSVFDTFIDSIDITLRESFISSFPSGVLSNLQTLTRSILFRLEYDKLTDTISRNKEQLHALEEVDVTKIKKEKEEMESLEKEIRELRSKRQVILTLLGRIKSVIKARKATHAYADKVLFSKTDIEELISLRKSYLLQLYLDKEITKARDDLYQLENIEVRIQRYKKDIESINILISELSLNVDAYKNIVQIIHPKGKEVAKSIKGFINIFIDTVNSHCAKVWTYPVELCHLEEDTGVTYRLPFKADGKVREDITMASTATGDMINIGVKLTIMEILGMNGYPLYLDELGSGYDAEHSKKLCNLIGALSENDEYSNLFIVSNDPDVAKHLSTMDADIVVLANNNITT